MRMGQTTFLNEAAEQAWLTDVAGQNDPVSSLRLMAEKFDGQAVFSTSFSIEDQVISHFIFAHQIPIRVFTLDTGRLFAETYSTWSRTVEKYQAAIDVFYPDPAELEPFVCAKGPNSFYDSVENRMQCCHIRKVLPLRRAIYGQKLWVTGIRAEHSQNRHQMDKIEWDPSNSLFKYHPLLHWSQDELKDYVRQHQIPVNPLHEKGFISIGCAPCTRAVKPGEDFRAGRWWWENPDKKECGLHVHAS